MLPRAAAARWHAAPHAVPLVPELMRANQFCSMRITQDVRDYAQRKGLEEHGALAAGLEEKAREFREAGSTVYQET